MTNALAFSRTADSLTRLFTELRAFGCVIALLVIKHCDGLELPRVIRLAIRALLADLIRAAHALINTQALRRIGWAPTRARRTQRPPSAPTGFRSAMSRGALRRPFQRGLPRPKGSIRRRLRVLADLLKNRDAHAARMAARLRRRVTRTRLIAVRPAATACVAAADVTPAPTDSS